MNFSERLIKYREFLKLNKRDMASHLNISESYYNLIESGKRTPSKKLLVELQLKSNKPEEYWLYGIEDEDYKEKRIELKSIKSAIEQLIELELINDIETLFTHNSKDNFAETLLAAAIRSDLSYLIKTKEK